MIKFSISLKRELVEITVALLDRLEALLASRKETHFSVPVQDPDMACFWKQGILDSIQGDWKAFSSFLNEYLKDPEGQSLTIEKAEMLLRGASAMRMHLYEFFLKSAFPTDLD